MKKLTILLMLFCLCSAKAQTVSDANLIASIDSLITTQGQFESRIKIWRQSKKILQRLMANKERSLGNPSVNGQALVSTTSGTRSWVTIPEAKTFSTGLSEAANVVTVNLSTGIAISNQNLIGSTLSGGTITISGTSHATKGKILVGSSAYDEVNNRLGIGTVSPLSKLHVAGGIRIDSLRGTGNRAIRVRSNGMLYDTLIGVGSFIPLAGSAAITGNLISNQTTFSVGNGTFDNRVIFSNSGGTKSVSLYTVGTGTYEASAVTTANASSAQTKIAVLGASGLGARSVELNASGLMEVKGTILTADADYTTDFNANTYAYVTKNISDDRYWRRDDLKAGLVSLTFNGVTTVFDIPHSIGGIPTSYGLTYADISALSSFLPVISLTSTTIRVTFGIPPTSGVNPVISWQAYR